MKVLSQYTILLLSLLLISISVTSCQHYQPGLSENLPFKTLYIKPVDNNSYAPQAQALLTENLIKSFLIDGSIKIVSEHQADAILEVTISDYERSLFASQSDDTVRARSFSLHLTAQASLYDKQKGYHYFENRRFVAREVTSSETEDGSSLPQAEYQTLPILTRELAKKIKDGVISIW